MRSTRSGWAAALLLLAACAVRGTPERPAVTRFDIDGTEAIDDGDLKKGLATEASDPWWQLFWRDARYFDEDAFAADRRRVEAHYRTRGYYRARVTEAAASPDGEGRVRVRMKVEEGEPVRVSAIRIVGMEGAPEARERAGDLALREGEVFTEQAFDEAGAALRLALVSTGYARGVVRQKAVVLPEAGQVEVTYTIEHTVPGATAGSAETTAAGPGDRYRFGNVFVAGAAAVPRARVREEAEIVVKPGQTFDATRLDRIQGRIFDLGVFGGVRVTQGVPDEKKKAIPVVVSVREAPFRTIRLGPGIGVEANRWDVSAIAGWSHRNWFGGLRRLTADLRVGYAWLPNPFAATEQGLVARGTLTFFQPGAIKRRLDLESRVELERGLEKGYSFTAERFRIGAPLRVGRVLTLTPSYNLELYQLSLVGDGAPVDDPAETDADLLFQCEGGCVLSYLEQRATLDLRDDPINTRRGLYLSLSVQEGLQFFGRGFQYLRVLPEARGYLPLGSTVLAGRLRLGLLRSLSTGESPIVARFQSGGSTFMRGYYTGQLSPVAFRGGDYVPVGGDRLVDGSIELRVPVGENLGTALFLDFGNVTFGSIDPISPERLQYAAGAGLRYNTLFGPLRLDLAARLPTDWSTWDQPGLRVVEADRSGSVRPASGRPYHVEPIVSVHLSIGEAF